MVSKLIHFENEAGFRALFEYATIGIIVSDVTGQIVISNPNAEKLFGYGPAELIGQPIEILIPTNLRNQHVAHRADYMNDPQPRSMGVGRDLHGVRKDGSEFSVETSLGSYQVEGERLVVCFITDITERKEYTQRLEKAVSEKTKQLKEALAAEKELNDLKSRFISIASHEFRTPLSAIISSATLIEKYIEREDVPNQLKHTDRIKSSARHLTNILSDFLSLEKLEEGMVVNQPERVDLTLLVREVLEVLKDFFKPGQKVDSTFNLKDQEVNLDQNLFRVILINLLSNASKYSEEEQNVLLTINQEDAAIQLEIQDFGIGIPLEDQKQLFNRFFRAGSVGNAKGTGLGLNIVKRYVEIMGGSISYHSKPGQGTRFSIQIPVHE